MSVVYHEGMKNRHTDNLPATLDLDGDRCLEAEVADDPSGQWPEVTVLYYESGEAVASARVRLRSDEVMLGDFMDADGLPPKCGDLRPAAQAWLEEITAP